MNSLAPLLNLKKHFRKLLIILGIAFLGGMVFMNLKVLSHPPLYNPYVIYALQYIMIFATGLLIYIGYRRYNQTVNKFKDSDDLNLKRIQYIKANRFQNNLVFIAFAVNVLAMYLTFNRVFLFLATVCLVINFIYMPSEVKFTSDFVEQIDEERYETEINPQDSNNINQNFES